LSFPRLGIERLVRASYSKSSKKSFVHCLDGTHYMLIVPQILRKFKGEHDLKVDGSERHGRMAGWPDGRSERLERFEH
jgi:hypothetical protein